VQRKAAYHHGDLRQQLLNATRQLVEEQGPEQFTVVDASRLAGVSTAAPYRHFENRDDMIDAAIIDAMARMKDQMLESLTHARRGTSASLAGLGKAYVAFAEKEPGMFRVMFRKVSDVARQEKLEAAGEETYSVLLGEVAMFLGKKEVDEQVLQLALPMWTFVHGTAVLLIDDHLSVSGTCVQIDKMVDSVCAQLTAGCGPC
jgi:AcrR family transcriptional regulator